MTNFWMFIAIIILVGLTIIWLPHFRQKRMLKAGESGVRKQTNLDLFENRLAVLEQELQEELLDQREFDALKKELEVSLLQDMKQGTDESLDSKGKPKKPILPIFMSIAIIAVAGSVYYKIGAYNALNSDAAHVNNPHAGMTPEQIMMEQVAMFEQQVQAEPENNQAWFDLGHAYIRVGMYDKAVKAFDNILARVGPAADIIGPKASALYYKAGQNMTPEVQDLINQSLALNPIDASTLNLVAMDAFYSAHYQKAIDAWQTVLDNDRGDVNREGLMNAISSAKMRLKAEGTMPSSSSNGMTMGAAPNDETHKNVATANRTVTVTVSITPELAAKVESSDMMFIFARATDSKMPVAATKISAKSLPVTVTLDDSTTMGGNTKLSDVANVEVIGVISKQGSIRAQPGDLQGKIDSINVGDSGELIIDNEVKS